jgi:hypothetical protein
MLELDAGEKCYVVSKQTASKEVSPITGVEQTVFNRTAVGFRFCEYCWEHGVAGKEYIINL